MLVLPMSSPSSSPAHQRATSPYTPRAQREESPQTSELRKKVASTMLSVLPSSSSPTPQRPKLSLQTSLTSSLPSARGQFVLAEGTDSPTTRNTQANTFEAPPPTPSSAVKPRVTFPAASTTFSSSPPALSPKGHISPFPHREPYALPIGTHSILRNSPLPKRHLSATSTRAPKRIFPPRKEVKFSDRLVELAPTPVFEEEEGDTYVSLTEEQREDRRRTIQQEDGHSISGQRRRRKRREWIWRPMEDDVLLEHGLEVAEISRLADVDDAV